MRLRSGLKIGDREANQAGEVDSSSSMQEEISSTQAEWGTPHPSSFSTTAQAPGSPTLGEVGLSEYRDVHQGLQHPHQDSPENADFNLFDSPAGDQDDEEELSQEHIPDTNMRPPYRKIRPRPAPTYDQSQPPVQDQEQESYPPVPQSYLYPTPGPFPTSQPQPQTPLPTLQTSSYQTPSTGTSSNSKGMMQDWTRRPDQPWSPGTQTPENRKRALSEQNPDHDPAGYPKDRDYPDKLETDLAKLERGGKGAEDEREEEEKRKKRPRRSQRKVRSNEKEHRDHRKDRDNGNGSGRQGGRSRQFASMV